MANIFKNPLVLAETVVGSLVDQRSVVLYEDTDSVSDMKTELENDLMTYVDGTRWYPTVEDFVKKRMMNELFTGTKVKYLSDINGFNMWGVSYMDADVNISSDLCDHPIETGQVITDSSIRNPVSATVNLVMPTAFYTTIFQEVDKYYKEKKKLVLLTKFAVYRNMVIDAMPYKLRNSDVDRPIIALSLRQIMEVSPTYEELDVSSLPAIKSDKALAGEDTDTEIVGQKRFTKTLSESLEV